MESKKLVDKLMEIKKSNQRNVQLEQEIAILKGEIATHFEKVTKLVQENIAKQGT